jgi:hypothetical protein
LQAIRHFLVSSHILLFAFPFYLPHEICSFPFYCAANGMLTR